MKNNERGYALLVSMVALAIVATLSGLLVMATQADAQKAISQFHEFWLAGRQLTVSLARPREAPVGYQSRLDAFGSADRGAKVNTPKPVKARGGYQSALSAFGNGKSAPTPPRRRGGSQRH